MDISTFTNFESNVMELITKGKNSYDEILKESNINEQTLKDVIEQLMAKNILKQTSDSKFVYQNKVNGTIVVLDGNILLPTTILKMNDKIYVSRGYWYEFPLDFDVRRIVWNVKLESKTNSTLVDMIQNSVLKAKKTKNVQLDEWKILVNKIVPYSANIGLLIKCVGQEITDVDIIFKIRISEGEDMSIEHRGFKISSEIDTTQLITELKKKVAERDFTKNIELNRIFNFSDFITSKNEIPIAKSKNSLTYVKITSIRKGFELTYYKMGINGNSTKISVDSYDDSNEGIEKLRELFDNYAIKLINNVDFLIEMSE